MLRITQLKLPVGHTEEQLRKKLLKTVHIKESGLKEYTIKKRSLDARKKRLTVRRNMGRFLFPAGLP